MIDGIYTEVEWHTVRQSVDDDPRLEQKRHDLEKAARNFLSRQSTAQLMSNAAARRDQWADVNRKASALAKAVGELGPWLPGTWDDEGATDPFGHRKRLLEAIEAVTTQADFCETEYADFAKNFSGRKNPDREDLYRVVLDAWIHLGRGLKWTDNGPLVRFFRAALSPLLNEDTPKSLAIRAIMNREIIRRAPLSRSIAAM